jgi:hypothetical protein
MRQASKSASVLPPITTCIIPLPVSARCADTRRHSPRLRHARASFRAFGTRRATRHTSELASPSP